MVGIDLGGTKCWRGSSAPTTGSSAAPSGHPGEGGAAAILQTIVQCVDEALARPGSDATKIAGAGIGSPGPLDPETGVILFSANLNVRNFPLGPTCRRRSAGPVLVQNDVRVGGYGEFRLGAGRGYHEHHRGVRRHRDRRLPDPGGQVLDGADRQRRRDRPYRRQGRRPAVRLRARGLPRGPRQQDGDRPADRQGDPQGDPDRPGREARRQDGPAQEQRLADASPRATRSPSRRSTARRTTSASAWAA